MTACDFNSPRLFVDADLAVDRPCDLDRAQAHYLLSVLRRGDGDEILAFNGRDGEWRSRIEATGRKAARLRPLLQARPQPPAPDLLYLFAPLKHARLDYTVQKAVEMGVGTLCPVLTRRTVATRVNAERMKANAIEAAEQCGILTVPAIRPSVGLPAAIAALEPERLLVFCDEESPAANPLTALAGATASAGLAVLIGPEGGFDPEERAIVLRHANVRRVSLGPRILRADTAAVAALAIVQAALGDWT